MDQLVTLLYVGATLGFLVAGLPQIIQILKTKTVEGVSLQTYDLWFVLQISSTPYIIQSGNIMWMISNAVWLVYYFAMILLIQHYRYPQYIRVIVSRMVAVLRVVPHRS